MAYSASVGVTTNADMGAFNLPGTPDLQGSFEADTLASADQFRMYDAFARAAPRRQDDDAAARLLPHDGHAAGRADAVRAAAERLQRVRRRHDARLRHRRVRVELAALRHKPPDQLHGRAVSASRRQGWAFQQHSLSPAENELTVEHVRSGEQDDADRGPALVARARRHRSTPRRSTGSRRSAPRIAVHPFQYLAGGRGGPPLRTLVDSGIKRRRRIGLGADLHAQPVAA